MKKRDKQKKKTDMPEFSFKEFTPEENRIYEEAVNSFREAVASGKTLQQAYESYAIEDPELKSMIQADFLKIMIAERHFEKRQSLEDVAKGLAVAVDLVKKTHARMLQEVGVSAASQFGEKFDSLTPKTND
jgi:DnaJ-domain-containing protein 1